MEAFAKPGFEYPSASQLHISGAQPTVPIPLTISPLNHGTHSPITALQTIDPLGSPISNVPAERPKDTLTHDNAPLSPNPATTSTMPNGGGSPFVPTPSGAPTSGACCENGRIILADPVTGKTVCSCQYDSVRMALSDYTRIQPATDNVGFYAAPYSTTDQSPYPSLGVDGSAFYPALNTSYSLKDSSSSSDVTAWPPTGLQPTTGFYSYDPALAAYGYGASYDLAARRKNATRESTATLKAWLNEHKKNPYPTKGEKIMLAIITKMTLTQVSTWFANARRRLKKENKMTWEPKNRTEDDDDVIASDEEKEKEEQEAVSRKENGAGVTTTGIGTGAVGVEKNPASNAGVGVISAQPKDLYQQQQQQQLPTQQQYSQSYYYSNNINNSNRNGQQQLLQHQQHIPMTAISQHVADNMLLYQHQHRLHQ